MQLSLPFLVFGGPCSNLEAVEAVLAEAARRGIAPERTICTGDLAAYCGDPAQTIAAVRRAGIQVVLGNCDEQLAKGAANCDCGFSAGSTCDRLSREWFAHASREVDEEQRAWLATLPGRIDLDIGGRRIAIVHGSVSNISQFVFASSAAELKQRELELAGVDGIVGGHCGLPFSQIVGGRLWHNPGIVGLPANDGTPRVWYSVLTPVQDGIEIEHAALGYDHQSAAAAMVRAGLPDEYRETLASGLWPSCDVLPYREIRERGVALEPGRAVWTERPPKAKPRRGKPIPVKQLWPAENRYALRPLDRAKFADPYKTAKGEERATVALNRLETLWFNTGTLCNLTCRNCYIESSPQNDRLVYITVDDVRPYLDEIERDRLGTREIAFTGGEPFMNPAMLDILELVLSRGFRALVLTNAMRPMMRLKKPLIALGKRYGDRLTLRVSLDHYTAARHEDERGEGSFAIALAGLSWLDKEGFNLSVAGRTMWGEPDATEREGYRRLFAAHNVGIDAADHARLVLFPEMDERVDVPEITTQCWSILEKAPSEVMCASQRMVVKRKGEAAPVVMPCTLIAYDRAFEMGNTLIEAAGAVALNHPHCAKFCVLGGASCSSPKNDELTAA